MSLIKRIRALSLCMITSCLVGASAYAAPIAFDIDGAPSSSVTATLNPGFCFLCSVSTTLNPTLDSVVFNLNAGESNTFNFFRISVGGFGGTTVNVSATLAFDIPAGVSVPGDGDGFFVTVGGLISAGGLTWTDVPEVVTLGDGSSFSVDFSDIAAFGFGNSAQVTATITALTGPSVPGGSVPEPTMLSLMAFGMLAVAALRRQRLREEKSRISAACS